jgi:rifampicin phosphotransferase
MPDSRLVLPFADPLATLVEHTGGKGASLAALTQAGFTVPDGVVVTAAAYRAFVAAWPEFVPRVAALPVTDAAALRLACSSLRVEFEQRAFPAAIEEALRAGLAQLAASGTVSVRSSATLEDSARAAFAGQHDSFLGIAGLASVLEHVRRCWASLWEDRAVRYRYENGFNLLAADMAVVVQRMVAARVAGVAFSINPITGATKEVLITAAYGLGETVVSGEGEVDQFTVAKADSRVLTRHIGCKAEEILQLETGTVRRAVEPERRDLPSLSDAQIAEIASLSQAAERHYAFPQDIEWAIDDGRLHLLQSRPITEFPEVWTRRESAERFPRPLTPLTWDFTSAGFHESLAFSLDLMGLPPFAGAWFARKDGYIYGNETAIEVFTAGHQIAFATLDQLAARVPEMRSRYRWVQELPVVWARDLDHYLLSLGRLDALPLSSMDDSRLWQHVLEIDRVGREYFRPNIAISLTQGMLHRLLFRMVALVVGMESATATYDALTAFCETKTGLVNRDIFALAGIARDERDLATRLVRENRRALIESGAVALYPQFAAAFARFLDVHGHREVEFDAYHPTWVGQPWVVLENVRLMLLAQGMPEPGLQDQAARSVQSAAEREFLSLVPEPIRNFAAEIVRLARTYTALDDLEHYQTTRLTPPFRAALVEMGRRLVRHGITERAEDIFFLRRASIEGFLHGSLPARALRAEALAAKAEFEEQSRTEPPFRLGEANPEPQEGDLRGLPGAPGVSEGSVRLIHSSDDFGSFRPGDVLVARTTNPAWTPLFYSAAAVITESGGPLSHGAVTAREVGIPAVMGVRGVLRRLGDGQRVRVDGTGGLVSILG